MSLTSKATPSRIKVREHRQRLREQGLRPIQIWVPDVRSSSFQAEARRQSLAVAASHQAADDQAFIDSISDWGDERGAARYGPQRAAIITQASHARL